jgi:hypothetical protein
MRAWLLMLLSLAAGCDKILGISSGTLGNPADGAINDGPTNDANLGPYAGQIVVADVALWGTSPDFSAHGAVIQINFAPGNGPAPPFAMSGTTGIPPCYAVVYDTTANPSQIPPATDEGPVNVQLMANGLPDASVAGQPGHYPPVFPSCQWQGPGIGYRCQQTSGPSMSLSATTSSPNQASYFNGNPAPNPDPSLIGMTVLLNGSLQLYPICGSGPSSIMVATPSMTSGTFGGWSIAAGKAIVPYSCDASLGIVTSGAAPEVFGDNDTISVAFAGTGGHVPAFTTPAIGVGGRWAVDAPTRGVLNGTLDLQGATNVVYACASPCNNATAMVVDIETSDGDPGTACGGGACPPGILPPPTRYRGSLICSSFNTGLTVPAQLLNTLGSVTVRAKTINLLRGTFQAETGVNVFVGEGYYKYE